MATRRTAPTHLVPVRVFRMPGANEDVDVDVGAVLCRTTDSLVEFRAVLKQHAAQPELSDDEEEEGEEGGAGAEGDDGDGLDPALEFMREGKFEFYLDEGKTRVRRKQEKGMKVRTAPPHPPPGGVGRYTHSVTDPNIQGPKFLDRVVVVRSADVKKPRKGSVAGSVTSESGRSLSAVSAVSDDTEAAAHDVGSIAVQLMQDMERARGAHLSFDATLAEPRLCQALKVKAAKLGVGEDAVALLQQLRDLRLAFDAAAPATLSFSSARLRLARIGSRAIAERFFAPGSRLLLPLSAENRDAAFRAWQAADADAAGGRPGADRRLVRSFDAAAEQTKAKLAPALKSLGAGLAGMHRVKVTKASREKVKVVVVGGGYAGALASHMLDQSNVHVTLVDPKEVRQNPRPPAPARARRTDKRTQVLRGRHQPTQGHLRPRERGG